MAELVLPHTIDAGTEIVANEHQENYVAIRDLINGNLEGGSGSEGNIKANGITARELADNVISGVGANPRLQEGVFAAGDLKVTPGAGLQLNYASGQVWVTDDSGIVGTSLLVPAQVTGASLAVAANASGNPRIDQIIATLTGWNTATVSVLQGTASVGATLDNRTGAAALPAGAVRLADILMPNGFAGPFVQATHIRDRRPWARGGHLAHEDTSGNVAAWAPANTGTLLAAGIPRLETSGGLIRVSPFVLITSGAATVKTVTMSVLVDGVLAAHGSWTNPAQAWAFGLAATWEIKNIAAGSHLFDLHLEVSAGSAAVARNASAPVRLVVDEDLRPSAANDGA